MGSTDKTLYRLTTKTNTSYWLKLYPEQRKFTQELEAYHTLASNGITLSPQLIGHSKKPPFALLLTECSGEICTESILNHSVDTEALFHHAGLFLKQLHNIQPTQQDSLTPYNAILRRFKAIKKGNTKTGYINNELIKRVEAELEELSNHQECLAKSFCHRDFSPRNWLYNNEQSDQNRNYTVIDFEHSLFDISLLDITKLNAHYFNNNYGLKEAFFNAYNSNTDSNTLYQTLNILTHFYGLQTLSWAYKYSDQEYIDLGEEAVSDLL